MDRKEFFTRGLDKIMLRVKYNITNDGHYLLYITRNLNIIKYFTGITAISPRYNNIVNVYDIKNNIFVDINLDLVESVELYGLPFTFFPEYIFNKQLDGKITDQELFEAQKQCLDKIKEKGTKLSNQDFENNFVSNDAINKLYVIKNAYRIIKEKLNNFVHTFDEADKQNFLAYEEPEIEEYEREEVEKTIALFDKNFPNIFDYISYVRACEVCELPIKLLNDSSEDIMTKCINIWKQKIQQHALDSIKNLTEEEEAIKTHGNEQDLEELTYIKELITNVVDEVDFSQFKTPKQLFSFWPSLLLPAPNYVVSIR
jgi:hypothetical protein